MKKTIKLAVLALTLGLTSCVILGCKNISPSTQRIIETRAVAASVEIGILKAPTARPYIMAVTPIVCAEAQGVNPSPTNIVAAIEAAHLDQTKTLEAVIIVNSVLGIYAAVVDQLDTNSAAMQNYAGGLCDGLQEGLAFSPSPPVPAQKRGFFSFRRLHTRHATYYPHLE